MYFGCENNHNMPKVTLTVSGRAWEGVVHKLAQQNMLFAPVSFQGFQDYERIDEGNVHQIIYNHPRPTTPIKAFFLPVKQNVTQPLPSKDPIIVMGIPACDLAAIGILDEMYLQPEYIDIHYKQRRENTLMIGTACHTSLDHCHCSRYGILPYPDSLQDVSLDNLGDKVILESHTLKGEAFLGQIGTITETSLPSQEDWVRLAEIRTLVKADIEERHANLPGYKESGELVASAPEDAWLTYADTCVSCGACSSICPTCTCFILIDRPDFEKIRQLDTCQYPGFARVAGGEDPMHALADRLKHRYMCKYVWKPMKFSAIACTGCGRCIDACIGKINKNEILTALASVTAQ